MLATTTCCSCWCAACTTVQGRVPLETAEQRANEAEVVEKTTTQMYRAPEMVDLYLERELTEKVDVWVSDFTHSPAWHLLCF